MKHLCRLFALLSFALLFSLPARTASAQGNPITWTQVDSIFHGQIHEVKFLDQFPGGGNIGFVCDDTGLSRTNDGGKTWVRCRIVNSLTPTVPLPSGYINDLAFSDIVHGFAILDSVNPIGWQHHGVLISSDSGLSWNFDDTTGAPMSGDGIYYNNASGRLFVASDDSGIGLTFSTNQGKTWKTIDTNTYYTGFSFTSPLNGIVATEGTICANGIYHNWLTTADGGVTWTKSRMFIEAWQPFGIPTTERYFGASNNDCLLPASNEILISDNGGFSFGPVTGYTTQGDMLNESMGGDGCMVFAASSVALNGMWYSRNDGASFNALPGSPNPPIDTRFYISPTQMWSFVTDTLYHNPRPSTADIHAWPLSINIKNAECNTTVDTVIHVFGCNCQNSLTLTGDSIHRVSADVSAQVTILPSFPPQQSLCNSGTGATDSLILQVKATAGVPDTFNVHLLFNDNGTVVDTTAAAEVNGLVPTLTAVGNPTSINITTPACNTVDTFIYFQNSSCDQITITRAIILSNAQDNCQLQLLGQFNLPVTLPAGAAPYAFEVLYEPGLRKACTQGANLVLEWHGSDGVIHDTKGININACTSTDLKPLFIGVNIDSVSCCDMPTYAKVYVYNTTCDTITLSKPYLTRTSKCGHFIEVAGHYPYVLPPQTFGTLWHDVDSILIECTGSACDDTVQFEYQISANFDSTNQIAKSLCNSVVFDTINIPISMAPAKPSTPTTIAPPLLNFGSIGCCDSTEVRTVTINTGCRADTVTSINVTAGNHSNYALVQPGPELPWIIPKNSQATFQIGFVPHCDSTPNDAGETEKGTVTVVTKNEGALFISGSSSTKPQIIATSTNLAAASLANNDTLDFGAVLSCGDTCMSIAINNASCGSVKTGILAAGTITCFSTPTFTPDTMLVGTHATISVCLNPSNCKDTGDILDSVILQVTDPNGGGGTHDTLYLKAHIIPALLGYTLTQIADTSICDSTVATQTFTLTDTATCYTLGVTSINGGNAEVTVTPQTATLTKGQQQTFTVHFAPTQLGNITGPIVLTLADGSTISVPYSFTSKSCTVGGVYTRIGPTPDTINTTNCTIGYASFTIGAGGGTGTVTGITVTGSNRFGVTTSSGTMTFADSISYDPNQGGADSASVRINYTLNGTPGTETFEVYGLVSGTKNTAHLGVVSLTQGCVLPNDTMLDTFAIVIRDAVPANSGLTTISFLLHYDNNLLFNPQTLNSNGWTATYKDTTGGVLVTLTRATGTGGFSANDTLLVVGEYGAISASGLSTAKLVNIHFNDSSFEACVLRPLGSTSDSASICIDTSYGCYGTLLYKTVTGDLGPYVSTLKVVPNPVRKDGSTATLRFTTNADATVTAEILDQLGRSTATLNNGGLAAGDHEFSIPTDRMAEGVYFARVTAGGMTVVRQFVLEKE